MNKIFDDLFEVALYVAQLVIAVVLAALLW